MSFIADIYCPHPQRNSLSHTHTTATHNCFQSQRTQNTREEATRRLSRPFMNMGGGDDYWRPASSHSHSSSSQPLSQSQPSSQASRNSVDLTELDRLRVLVKYEFETALSTEELIEALGACHNNTHEAYHYLKRKRKQQQQQSQAHEQYAIYTMHGSVNDSGSAKRRQDDNDVEIIENPSKRQREGTPPPPPSTAGAAAQAPARTLRLHSSQNVDMSPPASQSSQSLLLQRQQQPYQMTGSDTTAPPNTQQESEVEIVFSQRDVTPPNSQQQTAGEEQKEEDAVDMEMDASRAKAQQLLTNAVEDRRQNRITSDASWISSVLDLLRVSSNLEIAQQLDLTCDAMAAWLKEFEEPEVAANKRVGLELLFEVLAKLPRSDHVDELVRSWSMCHGCSTCTRLNVVWTTWDDVYHRVNTCGLQRN